MSEIPEDVWETARGLRSKLNWASNASVEAIAEFIMAERAAERERCASFHDRMASRLTEENDAIRQAGGWPDHARAEHAALHRASAAAIRNPLPTEKSK